MRRVDIGIILKTSEIEEEIGWAISKGFIRLMIRCNKVSQIYIHKLLFIKYFFGKFLMENFMFLCSVTFVSEFKRIN